MGFIPYTISSFRGGVSDEDNRGIKGSFKLGKNLAIHKRRDSLTCKQALARIGSATITDLVVVFVSGSDGTTYAFGNSGKIYSIAGIEADPVVALKATDANGEIKGAGLWGLDDDTEYLFWATDTSLARKLFPGNDAWGDESVNWRTTLQSGVPHTIKRACGRLMIANGRYLANVEYDGDFDAQVMNIEPGHKMKCLESRGDYVIIGSENVGEDEEAHLWSWITSATNYINKKKIPAKKVNALIDTELMLLQGGEDGELFLSDFRSAEPLAAVPLGGYVEPGGVAIDNDLALFGIYGGTYNGLWSFGRRHRNRPVALNFEYRIVAEAAGSTISKIGAVAVNNGVVLASYKIVDGSTTTYGVDQSSSTTKATAIYEGLEFDGGSPHLKKHFRDIHLTMGPLPTSCSVAVKVKLDKVSAWTDLKTAKGATSFSTANATEAVFLFEGRGRILEVGVTLTPSVNETPEILAVTTYVEEGTSEY